MNELPSRRDFMDKITEDDVFEAERTVLACILASNDLLSGCGLEWSDFVEGLHQTIFDKTSSIVASHQIADAVSIKPFLPLAIAKLPYSPSEYVENLYLMGASTARKAMFERAVQTIKSTTLARELQREAEFAVSVAKEGHTLLTLGDEIEHLEGRLKELRARFGETKAIASPGSSYLAAFQASAQRNGVVGVPIGLKELRRVLSESVFAGGNLYGLLSSSGEGKTSLTMQIIYHAVLQGHPVLFLSYDQSSFQCVRQMIAQIHGISVKQQDDPTHLMSQREQDTCVQFAAWIDHQPLEIIRCQREGVGQLVAYGKRFLKRKSNGKTPLIVIDHIKKIAIRDTRADAGSQAAEVTVELKAFADEAGAAVLLLNQRNSAGVRRDNPRPIDDDLHGGEAAKQDYDAITYLYRPQKYRAKRAATAASDRDWKIINKVFGEFGDEDEIKLVAEIGVIKNRFGDPDVRERLRFEAQFTRYVSMAPERPAELF